MVILPGPDLPSAPFLLWEFKSCWLQQAADKTQAACCLDRNTENYPQLCGPVHATPTPLAPLLPFSCFSAMQHCCLVTKSRPVICDPMDCSTPGSSVHGILQARILEWVATPMEWIFLTQDGTWGLFYHRAKYMLHSTGEACKCNIDLHNWGLRYADMVSPMKLMDGSCNSLQLKWSIQEARECSGKGKWSEVKSLSLVWLFATPWTIAH